MKKEYPATYKGVIEYVRDMYGYIPKTCWIADVKRKISFKMRKATNRISNDYVKNPCPSDKFHEIKNAIIFVMKYNYNKGGIL